MPGRFPFPLPNGWFAVAWSADLEPGDVKPVHYLDRELVVFRTESGQAHVFDAYCPHLGAHLGHGGAVVGETIRCPFHAWRFDGGGTCVDVPYAKKIPPQARIGSMRVVERYGQIFVWHHLENEPPFYQLPELPAFESDEWIPPHRHEFTLRTAIQEMAENDHDSAHFAYVHGYDYLPTTVSYDGLTKKCVSPGLRIEEYGNVPTTLERINYGLGLTTVEICGVPEIGLIFLSSVTPIDEDNVHARWRFTVTKNAAAAGELFIQSMQAGVMQDVPIWENKVYRERPVLCDGDGPIAEFRRWAKQFYS